MPPALRVAVFGVWLAAWSGPGLGLGPAAATWSDWPYRQELRVPAPGLARVSLPADTLDGARPGLPDLRLVDDAGSEVPYLLDRPRPSPGLGRAPRSFQATLGAGQSVLTIETGLAEPLDGIVLRTPARTFLKAVQVDASNDQATWRTLARGVPIFREPGGAGQLLVGVPPGTWRFLRLTVDDRRAPPIPFTGAELRLAAPTRGSAEPVAVRLVERVEEPEASRFLLDLGAAHLQLSVLHVETPEPLFARRVTLLVRDVEDHVVRERPLADGVIHRVAVEGYPPAAQLAVPLDVETPSRELVLRIHHGDSPPLAVGGVRAERRPVWLVFLARRAGTHVLLAGNRQAAAPQYDLAALRPRLTGGAGSRVTVSPRAANPEFQPGDALPGVPTDGAVIDVTPWMYRKRVQPSPAGVHQLELDLDVLARAQPGLGDLRLVTGGRQVPYVLEPDAGARVLRPTVTPADDPKRPRVSRWALALPHPALPVARLSCASRTPLFRRQLVLVEETLTERGERLPRRLGGATWARTPGRPAGELTLALTARPATDRLVLEADNGDNPPIELGECRVVYPATRLVYRTTPDRELHLYYGHATAEAPRYDLRLVAATMLEAEKTAVTLGAEERLRKPSWREAAPLRGHLRWIFWGALALVVLGLLATIARILPRGAPPSP